MKPTERQEWAIRHISNDIAWLKETNDLHSPTHHCSILDDFLEPFEDYKDLELLKTAYLDILQFIRNNP